MAARECNKDARRIYLMVRHYDAMLDMLIVNGGLTKKMHHCVVSGRFMYYTIEGVVSLDTVEKACKLAAIYLPESFQIGAAYMDEPVIMGNHPRTYSVGE